MTIRWLHLSDVHEHDADGYHRKAMYDAILKEAKTGRPPDFVFITGDLAFAGTAHEYDSLKVRLLEPLRSALATSKFFLVPGNHDVDRNQVVKPRLWMEDEDERKAFQTVGPVGQRKRRSALLPRFQAYRDLEKDYAAWRSNWLDSEQGSICQVETVNGRKLAIVGINTAWLAQDDRDAGRLTAGVTMVDAALTEAMAAKPELVLVLGHHPLEAMSGETKWADYDRIRQTLIRANAVYLHGHLHITGQIRTGDSTQAVVTIQAPSAFQAADDPRWRNGLLWGEADLDSGRLVLTPKRWSDKFAAYVDETEAFDPRFGIGSGSFALSLPGRDASRETEADPHTTTIPAVECIAEGWEIITAASLAALTFERPAVAQMKDWFDGQFPRWETAVADGVRPRQVVEHTVHRFAAARLGAPEPIAVLLTGAGGEGKSAALLQTVASLLRSPQDWTCLWRSAAAAPLPEDLFAKLEMRPGHAWVIAVDDAESLGRALPAALQGIQPRTDVHLLLAARDADWSIRNLTDDMWKGTADFRRVTLAGLDAEDARRIADGWVAYGNEAMGRLRGQSAEQAAHALLGHAQEQAAKKQEGALLGALLITREGEDFKARVTRLMQPWAAAAGIGRHSLLDIYAMIAAMHAENQLYLSRSVLAFALDCDEAALDRGPLYTLRREAMVDGGSTYVLTRHRQIAEAARDWLVEVGYDVDRWYPFLATAAMREFKERYSRNPDIANWMFELANHFVLRDVGRWPVAVAVAKALFERSPGERQRLTAYSAVLRRTRQPGAALALLRREGVRFSRHRDVIYEWSVAAGESNDHGLDVWLVGRSLADDKAEPLSPNQTKLSLAGLGAAFGELRKSTGQLSYAVAQAACGRLGLTLSNLDSTSRGYFRRYLTAVPEVPGQTPPTIEADLTILRVAVVAGSEENDPANDNPLLFENLLGDPGGYQFTMLHSVLATDGGASPKVGPGRRRPPD